MTKPIASLASHPSGTRRSTCHALMEAKDATRQRMPSRAGSRMAHAAAGTRCERRLGGRAAGCAAGRLGFPIQQRPLPRSRRHGRGRDGAGSCGKRSVAERGARHADRARQGMGRRPGCKARTAATARSTPTTPTTASTTSRSPITVRCSIRRRKTFRADASACWRSWGNRRAARG